MTEFPEGWVRSTLAEISRSSGYGTSAKCGYGESGVGVLRIPNIQGGSLDLVDLKRAPASSAVGAELMLEAGDLLLVRTNGSRDLIGRCAPVTDSLDCSFASYLIRFRLNAEVADVRFVARMLAAPEWRTRLESAAASSAGQYNLSLRTLEPLPVVIAPLDEQRRIVTAIEEAFSKLDAGEAGLRRVRQLVKRLREAVLAAAVTGQLFCVSGEVASDDATLEALRQAWTAGTKLGRRRSGTKGTDAPVPKVDLPPSWRWVRWSQLGHCQNGRAFPSDHYQDHGVPLLRPGNLAADGRVRWTEANTRYLPEHYAQLSDDLLVGPSEVVMNLTAQSLKDDFLGRACITSPVERCLLNQRLARLTPFATSSAYALLFFRSPVFRDFVKTLNKGSLIQHMYTHQVNSCWIPLPPRADQDTAVAECERSLSVVDNLERTVETAALRGAGLRRSVLKAAFEGQLVEQASSDEPASVLLERIRDELATRDGPGGGRRRKKMEAS